MAFVAVSTGCTARHTSDGREHPVPGACTKRHCQCRCNVRKRDEGSHVQDQCAHIQLPLQAAALKCAREAYPELLCCMDDILSQTFKGFAVLAATLGRMYCCGGISCFYCECSMNRFIRFVLGIHPIRFDSFLNAVPPTLPEVT